MGEEWKKTQNIEWERRRQERMKADEERKKAERIESDRIQKLRSDERKMEGQDEIELEPEGEVTKQGGRNGYGDGPGIYTTPKAQSNAGRVMRLHQAKELNRKSHLIVNELRRGKWKRGVLFEEMQRTPGFEHISIEDLYCISEGHGCRDGTKRIEARWEDGKLVVRLLPKEMKKNEIPIPVLPALPPIFPMPIPMNLMIPNEEVVEEWKKCGWKKQEHPHKGGWWETVKLDDTEGGSREGDWRTATWHCPKDEDNDRNWKKWSDNDWNEWKKQDWSQNQDWNQNGWKDWKKNDWNSTDKNEDDTEQKDQKWKTTCPERAVKKFRYAGE